MNYWTIDLAGNYREFKTFIELEKYHKNYPSDSYEWGELK